MAEEQELEDWTDIIEKEIKDIKSAMFNMLQMIKMLGGIVKDIEERLNKDCNAKITPIPGKMPNCS